MGGRRYGLYNEKDSAKLPTPSPVSAPVLLNIQPALWLYHYHHSVQSLQTGHKEATEEVKKEKWKYKGSICEEKLL